MQPTEPQQPPIPQQPQEYPAQVPSQQPVQPTQLPNQAIEASPAPQTQQFVSPIEEPQVTMMPQETIAAPLQETRPEQPVESPAALSIQPSTQTVEPELVRDEYEEDMPTELPQIAPVTWQAKEYLQHDKTPIWYVGFGVVVVVLMALSVWLQAWTFALLVPIMAAALAVYAHRPPRVVSYSVSDRGLTINDQLHPMGEFKSFGVLPDAELHALMLVPVKRFRPGVTLYFPDEVGEQLVDTLGAFLPMQDLHVDIVDKVIRKLRI